MFLKQCNKIEFDVFMQKQEIIATLNVQVGISDYLIF